MVEQPVTRMVRLFIALLVVLLVGCRSQLMSQKEEADSLARDRAELAKAAESLENSDYEFYWSPNAMGPRLRNSTMHADQDRRAVSKWTNAVKQAREAMKDWQRHNYRMVCFHATTDEAARDAARERFVKANMIESRELYDELCARGTVDGNAVVQRYMDSDRGDERNTLYDMGLYLRHWLMAINAAKEAADANHDRYRLIRPTGTMNVPYILQHPAGARVKEAEANANRRLAEAKRHGGNPYGVEAAQRAAEGKPPGPKWPQDVKK